MLRVYLMKYDSQCCGYIPMQWLTLLKLNPEDIERRRQRERQNRQLETAQQREERLLRRRVRERARRANESAEKRDRTLGL